MESEESEHCFHWIVKFYMSDYNSNSHSFASENQHLVAFNNIIKQSTNDNQHWFEVNFS